MYQYGASSRATWTLCMASFDNKVKNLTLYSEYFFEDAHFAEVLIV